MFRNLKRFFSNISNTLSKHDKIKTLKHVNIEGNITKDLNKNLSIMRTIFYECSDIVFKEFKIGSQREIDAAVIYVDGLTDRQAVHDEVLRPLMYSTRFDEYETKNISLELLKTTNLIIGEVKEKRKIEEIVDSILSGDLGLFIDGINTATIINARGWERRNVEEPEAESVNRGPREGFVETLRINTALIRRKIKHPGLKLKTMKIGERTNTDVAVMYMEEIAKKEIVDEVFKRLETIKIDGIFESGYIEQFIEDNPYSPFPQVDITERPDKVAAELLEGKVAIIVDGTPLVCLVPAILINFFQSPEDYYERMVFGTIIRWLRLVGFIIATTLPSLYVALITYHTQLIPIQLVETLGEGRAEVPFPPILEALLMEVLIDLLREANLRLPGSLGQTIGVVGAIVIGQAAVSARLASPAMVIIVSITTVGAYIVPRYSTSYPIRFLRYPMIFSASILGVFGIVIVWLWIIIHLCSLESFGQPYLSPYTPFKWGDMKDAFIRGPLWAMKRRPTTPESEDKIRQDIEKGRFIK